MLTEVERERLEEILAALLVERERAALWCAGANAVRADDGWYGMVGAWLRVGPYDDEMDALRAAGELLAEA